MVMKDKDVVFYVYKEIEVSGSSLISNSVLTYRAEFYAGGELPNQTQGTETLNNLSIAMAEAVRDYFSKDEYESIIIADRLNCNGTLNHRSRVVITDSKRTQYSNLSEREKGELSDLLAGRIKF